MGVSSQSKAEFIVYLLENYEVLNRSARFILNNLRNDARLLERVHFVNNLSSDVRYGLLVTTKEHHLSVGPGTPVFMGIVNNNSTSDTELMRHTIKHLDEEEHLFIQVEFPNKMRHSRYLSILEDFGNGSNDVKLNSREQRYVDSIIHQSVFGNVKNNLLIMIDEALENNNKERFQELAQMLNNIDNLFKENGETV